MLWRWRGKLGLFSCLGTVTTLQWALGLSIFIHGGLLGLRFASPASFDKLFKDSPLEVILVNASADEAPKVAQAIAQATLAGGGDLDAGRATSPMPATALNEIGNAADEAHKKVDQLQDMQQQLLAQVRREMAMLPPPDPRQDSGTPQERDHEERRRQLLKLLAEIEKRVNDDNAQPRKRYISPATQEAAYAVYYDQLRRRIEERGTLDFPVHQGHKLYGALTMNLTINARGQVLDAEVVQSSGNTVLDRHAQAIVRLAAPYGTFSMAMLREADQIVVTSRFRFTRDDGLETTLSAGKHCATTPCRSLP